MVNKDALFDELSKKFPAGNYTTFCNQMGVDYNEARSILTRFKDDYNMALRHLLSQWDLKMKGVTRKQLEDALDKAEVGGLCSIVKKHYAKGEHGEMPDLQVQRLREKLKAKYIEEFSQVKVSPMDPESRTWLQHIFVSLILMLGCNRDPDRPIGYDELFSFIQTKTAKGFITRVAFLGEAGVGKSTLFAKIALDWAMGKCLQDITFLFHESFRDIEDNPFFGNIVMNHFPDDTEIKGEWIDEYIKKNQRKVLILLDGLDEAKMDMKCQKSELAIVPIVRAERFIGTPVLISTRPFGADQIKSIPKIHEKYNYIKVKGFTKENTTEYVKQFFKNKTTASGLIHFMSTNSVVSQFMAPFPIFCCMLCYMWEVESKRGTTEKLQTISQLMKEIDFTLREQYSSRYTDSEGGYPSHMKKAAEAIVKVGRVAFEGLLQNQLIFTKEEMEACGEAAGIACQVGILSGEKRLTSRKIRQRDGEQFIQEFRFPHKLLQEYTASLYLAWLYNLSRSEFEIILIHKMLKDCKTFRYVLYFTAAHGGELGKSVMEALCKEVDGISFINEVAFECHDSEAIDSVRSLLKAQETLDLSSDDSNPSLFFTLETIGKEVIRRSSSIRENASSSHVSAVGLFTLQNLQYLVIKIQRLENEFYTGMSAAASQSMIEELHHWEADLGSAASSHFARGLCFMPHLRSLWLENVELSDEFYSTMASEASRSKIQALRHSISTELGSAASSHYARSLCFMPNLRSLDLEYIDLSDEFYSTMASEASKSKIEELTHTTAYLSSAASSHYARGLCFMPNLRSLTMTSVRLRDEFYSTMASKASRSKIEELRHSVANMDSAASSHYARGLCFMPHLRLLKLDYVNLSDEFYSTLASEASKSKIEELTHKNADLSSVASSHYARGLCSMPYLRSLTLSSMKLGDKFYSTMASEAWKSKIEELTHHKPVLGSAASSHYARGLCSMPYLRSLKLHSVLHSVKLGANFISMFSSASKAMDSGKLSDEFYSTMASEASKSKIEELTHSNAILGSDASSHYARGLCSMPNLRSLTMNSGKLSDEFYSTLASDASKSKIEELRHSREDLGVTASFHYARGLCFMPNLRSLGLNSVKVSDAFYSTMASEASKSKIEELTHDKADLGSAASSHYARGLCFMPNLRSLGLNSVRLSDEFFSTMASEALKSKIQTLSMVDVSILTPCRLHSIVSLPRLQSLTMKDIERVDTDDGKTLTGQITSVDELSVDVKHVNSLWNIGLHTSCPRVQKLQLNWQHREHVSSDVVTMACSPFHRLTHLHIEGSSLSSYSALNDPVSFCDAVQTSCPRLTKLCFTFIALKNKEATEIIQLLKTHPHLTGIELHKCRTTAHLDPLISEVNSEGKLTVTAKHGVFA